MPDGPAAKLPRREYTCPVFEHALRAAVRLSLGAMVAVSIGTVARAETLTIQGSSTFSANILTPNQAAIEALSGQSLKIVGIRSDIGLLRLLAHQAEFAVISTSLSHAVEALRANSPDLPYDKLMAFPVSQVRVAFAVNPRNSVRKVDMRLIRKVLSGEVTNWKQLGGANEPIRVAYVQAGGGVTLCVAGELFAGRPFTPANPIRVAFGAQVVKVVEQEPRALGIAQLGLVKEDQLAELATDQVIEQELSLVTLGEPSPEQQAVINAVRKIASDLGMPVVK
jgi:phosphate transport system substrate-binding protein